MDKTKQLEDDIKKLLARKSEMGSELTRIDDQVKAKNKALGASILSGNDTARLEVELTSMRTRRDGLGEAIVLADSQLAALRPQLNEAQKEAGIKELEGLDQTAQADFMAVLSSLYETAALLEKFSGTVSAGLFIVGRFSLTSGTGIRLDTWRYPIREALESVFRLIEKNQPALCKKAQGDRPDRKSFQPVYSNPQVEPGKSEVLSPMTFPGPVRR